MKKELNRCSWAAFPDELYTKYHDNEWGVPLFNDQKIFEFLTLEVFQAGLSWRTVLYKRENFRKAFDNFDIKKISRYNNSKVAKLMQDPSIIRNNSKILATINNSKIFLEVQKEFGTFANYMWSWVNNKQILRKSVIEPTTSPESIAWGKDLKKRGFKFLGPVVLYSHMQAVGMINDHQKNCFRFRSVSYKNKTLRG